MNQETTQHVEESALGVHPTCSVSTISSGPNVVADEASVRSSRRQYVLPGSKSVASPLVAPGGMATDDDDDEVSEEYVV
jgi:hypothetical protein